MTFAPHQDIKLTFQVDWDNDGNYNRGAATNITKYVKSAKWNVGFRDGDKLVADEMRLELVLDNNQRIFSPENPASPIYNLYPINKRVKVSATYETTTYTLWTGWLETLQPTPGTNSAREARLTATGPRRFMQKLRTYLPLLENVTVDAALLRILANVVLPPQGNHAALDISGRNALGSTAYLVDTSITSSLETGIETFSYVGDTWEDGVDAVSAIAQLVGAERGRFFIARDGVATFWNRYHMVLDTTIDWTIRDQWRTLDYSYGEAIYNVVSATYSPRTISAGNELLWQLDEPVTLEATKSRVIRANFSEQGADSKISGRNVVRPEVATGTLVMDSEVALVRFDAAASSAELEFTNLSATAEQTVSTVEIWGRKLTSYNTVTISERDGTSAYRYGERELKLDMKLSDDDLQVRSIVQYELARRKNPQGTCSKVVMDARSPSDLRRLLTGTVGTRVQIVDTQAAHDGEYFVVGEEHQWNNALNLWQVTWYLENASNAAFALLDDRRNAKLDSTAVLI